MPFTVDKGALDRYAAGLPREVAADVRGALGWFGAGEPGPSVEISRHDLQQFVHYTLPRKFLTGAEEHVAVAPGARRRARASRSAGRVRGAVPLAGDDRAAAAVGDRRRHGVRPLRLVHGRVRPRAA